MATPAVEVAMAEVDTVAALVATAEEGTALVVALEVATE